MLGKLPVGTNSSGPLDDLPDPVGVWSGLATGPFEDEAAAIAEADRRVAAHLAGEGGPP
jgi:hypothetical protein